jgi:hypothetical protein
MTTTPSVEIEKRALSHGVDAVFSVDDELITLALNAREMWPEEHAAVAQVPCRIVAAAWHRC